MSISTWISLWKLSRDDKLMDVKLSWVCGAVTLKFNICIYKGTNSTICHPCFWLSTLKLFADCSKFNKYTFSLSNTHTHTETPKTKKNPIEINHSFGSIAFFYSHGKSTAFNEIKIQTCLCFLWEQPWQEP